MGKSYARKPVRILMLEFPLKLMQRCGHTAFLQCSICPCTIIPPCVCKLFTHTYTPYSMDHCLLSYLMFFRLSGPPGGWLSGCLGSWPLQSKERADTRLQFWPWNCWPGRARVGPSVSGGLLRWPIPGPFSISGAINRLRICPASGPSGGI